MQSNGLSDLDLEKSSKYIGVVGGGGGGVRGGVMVAILDLDLKDFSYL